MSVTGTPAGAVSVVWPAPGLSVSVTMPSGPSAPSSTVGTAWTVSACPASMMACRSPSSSAATESWPSLPSSETDSGTGNVSPAAKPRFRDSVNVLSFPSSISPALPASVTTVGQPQCRRDGPRSDKKVMDEPAAPGCPTGMPLLILVGVRFGLPADEGLRGHGHRNRQGRRRPGPDASGVPGRPVIGCHPEIPHGCGCRHHPSLYGWWRHPPDRATVPPGLRHSGRWHSRQSPCAARSRPRS